MTTLFLRNSDGKQLATFSTPGGNHLAAPMGSHTTTKPVLVLALAVTGLIGAFHDMPLVTIRAALQRTESLPKKVREVNHGLS